MKSKIILKSMVIISCLLLPFSMQAQDVPPITLHVETAGTLPTLIASNRKNQITNLTLTGNLNGTDIRYIREMAGSDYINNPTDGQLSVLDLSGANIVSGGMVYSGNNRTNDNTIGSSAFQNCTSLTNITIPNSVTSIGRVAFRGCTSLTSVTIGNSVTSIGEEAFRDCTSLKEFIVSEGNTQFSSIDGVLFNKDKTILIFYPNAKSTSYTIPNSVTSIGEGAFSYCTSLTSVTIGNSVTSIGEEAFSYCTSLTSVTIGNSVTSIGEEAFRNCTSLKEIHNNNPVPQAINSNVFYNVNISTCKLYVPKGSYNAYWIAPAWGIFASIIEDGGTSNDYISNKSITISNYPNGISINAEQPTTIYIFNMSGQKVYEAKIQGTENITLNKGIYVVRVGNESQKIVVR